MLSRQVRGRCCDRVKHKADLSLGFSAMDLCSCRIQYRVTYVYLARIQQEPSELQSVYIYQVPLTDQTNFFLWIEPLDRCR